MRFCICADWIKYIPRLDELAALYYARKKIQPLGDDWKYFEYCPYCGEKLRD
jgi:hypothetical protein